MTPNLKDLFLARYEKGGRGPRTFDCFGLFAEICRRRGVAVPNRPTPESWADREAAILAGIESDWVRLARPEPWCAVAFRIGGFVCHLGTVLPDGIHFIHAEEDLGVLTSRLDSPMWAQRIAGYYRHA